MPYARELTVPMGVINDTFETAITWDRFEAFHAVVRKATAEALKEATGNKGVVSTRFTHVYPDGPAIYYTFSVHGDPGRLIEQWRHIKTRASDALIAAGGTITHHHAVGRDHMPWYREQRPDLFGKAFEAAKRALDPAGIMNPGCWFHEPPTEQRPTTCGKPGLPACGRVPCSRGKTTGNLSFFSRFGAKPSRKAQRFWANPGKFPTRPSRE